MYHVRLDGLRYSREIIVKGARLAKFNGHGGLIAVACSRRLEIYRTYTEECIGGFTGHSMPITSFTWHKDDMSIVSCSMDGSVYEWSLTGLDGTGNTPCGTRAGEHHCGMPTGSGFSYNAVVCGANGSIVVSGAVQGALKSNISSIGGKMEGKTPVGFGSGSTSRSSGKGNNDGSGSGSGSGGGGSTKKGYNSEHRMIRGWRKKHLDGKGFVCATQTVITSVVIQSHHLVAAGKDGSMTFYDYPLELADRAGQSSPHQSAITAMAVSPDEQIIFTGGIDGTIIMSEVKSTLQKPHETKSAATNAATSTRPYLDEIICLTDTQEQDALQGRIADLEASIIDIQGTYRYEKRETTKKHQQLMQDADQKLANTKRMAHEEEVELKRLLRASESEGTAKSDAKESQHMQTAKLLEDLYDRKLVMKQEDLRDTQTKLRDLIVRHEDARVKQKNDIDRLVHSAEERETTIRKKFTKEKRQMEQYIQFIKERYEDTAEKGEDMHDVELLKERQSFEMERHEMELKMQTAQGEIVLLKKSASMMKESLDEEKQRADMARADKMSCERRMKAIVENMSHVQVKLKDVESENQLKDEQIKSHLRRVGDLERVRRVLQHQLHEARGQLEPMDTELTSMKEQITELNKEYTSGMRAAAVLERKTKSSGQRQTMLQRELGKTEAVVASLRSTIMKFSRDVENIVTAPGSNPSKWAEGLLSLYREYVTNLPVKGKIRGPGEDTMKEFDRQRMFMEKTVKALKKQSDKSKEMVVATKRRVAGENTVLVTELNDLRKTVKRLKNAIERLESEKLQRDTRRSSALRKSNSTTSGGGSSNLMMDVSKQQLSGSASSSVASSVDERRRSALQQVARTQFASRENVRSSSGRRPASAVAGAAGTRPKSGGRPLTAQERRRRMPVGPSLSRSMSQLRASKSEKTLSVVQTRLDEAYMRDKAKSVQIQRLTQQLREREHRNRQLEDLVSNKVSNRNKGGGSVMSNGRLLSPGSASILSEYSKTSSSSAAAGGGDDIIVVNEPTSPTTHDKNHHGRQLLSPLAQRAAVKNSLRVG